MSAPGAPKPSDVERVAMLGTGNPHLDYPLRHIAESGLAIRVGRGSGDAIGRITKDKAMKEAFVGATYMHLRRCYRVTGWKTTGYENTITVEPTNGSEQPKPLFDTIVNVSHDQRDLIDRHLLKGVSGSIAETCMRVVESVYGFTIGGKAMLYSALSATDPRMRSKHREFGTTGVVIRIDEPWFKGAGENQLAARRNVAQVLAELLMRDRSISTADVSWAHSGITIYSNGSPRKLDDPIVIFDNVQGGLRLTAPLYEELEHFIGRLRKALAVAGGDAPLSEDTIARLSAWHETLEPPGHCGTSEVETADHERIIYAEGSVVRVRFGSSLEERRLLSHEMVTIGATKQLMYRYGIAPGASAWVPHEMVEPIGDGWRHVILDLQSNVVREIAA